MQNKFSEYYQLKEAEIKAHWESDIFSFDANVLLNLYRYTPSTRKAFFDILESIKERIWVPYQAAREYQQNRLNVINAQKEAYRDIRETLTKKRNEINEKLNGFKKHPYLQSEDLKKQIESAFQSINKDLENIEKKHPDYLMEDPVLIRLTDLLDQRVGDDTDAAELNKIYKEGRQRYEEKIPPGYMDQKDKKNGQNRSLYGDLIVWRQLISKAQNIESSIVFVTDDLKEDWWYKFKGRTIGPRPELIKEFRDETDKRINIYQADRFLEYAHKTLKSAANQDAIDEIRKVRLADEKEIEQSLSSDQVNTIDTTQTQNITEKSRFEKALDLHIEDFQERQE